MDTVTISQAEYDRLRADSTLLHLLEEEGVKEWEGYENALARMAEDGEEE